MNYLGDAALVVYSQEIDQEAPGLNPMQDGGLAAWVNLKGKLLKILLNGDAIEMESGTTVEALLSRLDLKGGRVAVAVNGELSPRSEHGQRSLQDGDAVEVIHAVAGG
jgi:sulfur carrier protein